MNSDRNPDRIESRPGFYWAMLDTKSALIGLLGSVAGALGLMLASLASHGGDAMQLSGDARLQLGIASAILIAHALLLLLITVFCPQRRSLVHLAACFIIIGLCLFCGDLTARALAEGSLFSNAAPIGGITLMIGWAVLATRFLLRIVRRM
jgi:uncharacterized membrane protein YgdD (TMEM256/DUF423 family)